MNRLIRFMCVLALAGGFTTGARGFALLGPYSSAANGYPSDWQVPALAFNLPGDIGGPKFPSEAYRWNTKVITYAFDKSFFDFFGTVGVSEVEKAIKILNDLPRVSQITNDGSSLYIGADPVPTDNARVNYEAEALGLFDLKSTALVLLLEQMGLAEAERYVWALRNRVVQTFNNVTITNYTVINLNYDPITHNATPFVNGVPYGYVIEDPIITPNVTYADAVEKPLDVLGFTFSSVAGKNLIPGRFYPGLTHDDVGGLMWLWATNNLATESLLADIQGGRKSAGSSPWIPFLSFTNGFASATNITFPTNGNLIVQGLRPGPDKIVFKRVNFDSVVGSTFTSVSNSFTDTVFTNGHLVVQAVQRVSTQPDIVFVVQDLGFFGNSPIPIQATQTGTGNWLNNDLVNGQSNQGGPGVIRPPIQIIFTSLYPVQIQDAPGDATLGDASVFTDFAWGSFDGTTNVPVIYPVYGSYTVEDLRAQILNR